MLKLAKVKFFSKHAEHKLRLSLNISLSLNTTYSTDTDRDRKIDTGVEIPKRPQY